MKKETIIFAALAAAASGAEAQDIGNFSRERERMIAEYNGFRNDIIGSYAKFLGEAWSDYKAFRGEKRFPGKKPSAMPEAPAGDNTPQSAPEEIVPQSVTPRAPKPDTTPLGKGDPVAIDPLAEKVAFSFYGTGMKATKVKIRPLASVSERDISECWARMQQEGVYDKVKPSLKMLVAGAGLSDWLVFALVRQYAGALCHGDSNTAIILSHYLLVNMGYDIRLGRTGGEMALLVNFRQTVYARPYLQLDGKRYSIYLKDNSPLGNVISGISTCAIPKGTDLGRPVNLIMSAPKISSGKGIPFEVSANGISVSGSVDETAKRIAAEFPQTDIPVYAASCLQEGFRSNLLSQVGEQVKGMPERDAANAMLQFVQLAFKYATDGEQFGYEKPFFAEEDFIYPANDCEDRAILFAILVRNILHLDVHLLHYPNHEATAVAFTDQSTSGDGYTYEGKRFTICDPTYFRASIGQCMPQFKDVKPEVELW